MQILAYATECTCEIIVTAQCEETSYWYTWRLPLMIIYILFKRWNDLDNLKKSDTKPKTQKHYVIVVHALDDS